MSKEIQNNDSHLTSANHAISQQSKFKIQSSQKVFSLLTNSMEEKDENDEQSLNHLLKQALKQINRVNQESEASIQIEKLTIDSKVVFDYLKDNEEPLDLLKKELDALNKRLREKYFLWQDLKQVQTLGEGGQGEVSKIFDPYNRVFYAKKVPSKTSATGTILKEIQILLEIIRQDDPSLLKIYSIEVDPKTTHSILMKFGIGDLLSYHQFRKENHLEWKDEELLYLAYEIYSQMLKLKNLGIYHRDIKPQNIIISNDGTIKLADFGLSCISNNDYPLTAACGTPGYWAPEVEEAWNKKILREYDLWKADIYSLGKTIQYISKDTDPLTIPLTTKLIEAMLTNRIVNVKSTSGFPRNYIDRFEEYSLKKTIVSIPQIKIVEIIERMLESNLYETCSEWIEHSLAKSINDDQQKRLWEGEMLKYRGILFFEQGDYDKAIDMYNKVLTIQTELKDSIITSQLYTLLGRAFCSQGKYEEAHKYHQMSLSLKISSGHEPNSVAASHIDIGHTFLHQGCYHKAIESISKAHDIQQTIYKDEASLDLANTLDELGEIYLQLQESDQAFDYCHGSLEIRLKKLNETDLTVAKSYYHLGNVYLQQGLYRSAHILHTKALEIRKKFLDLTILL